MIFAIAIHASRLDGKHIASTVAILADLPTEEAAGREAEYYARRRWPSDKGWSHSIHVSGHLVLLGEREIEDYPGKGSACPTPA